MIRIISSIIYHERLDNKGVWAEPERQNPDAPISFFIHDGQNLHVLDGFSGDSHTYVGFPYETGMNGMVFGRVKREMNRGTANTDPDNLTTEIFEKIVGDVFAEYGRIKMSWEWQNDWYTAPELFERLEKGAILV